jgi:hypothetical protein
LGAHETLESGALPSGGDLAVGDPAGRGEERVMIPELTLSDVPRVWFVRPDDSDASDTIHGVRHTFRVWVHTQEIAETLALAEREREALHFAALWHDIGRTHDGADYYHGAKSAGRAVGMGLHLPLDPFVREAVLFAVTHHSGSEEHAKRGLYWTPDPQATWRVFQVLKDADGLDRVRLGGLDVGYLRLPESRLRVERAWELLQEIPEVR